MTQAYPLLWPAGWLRTKATDQEDGRSRFRRGDSGFWTFAAARDSLYEEAARLGSPTWNTVISTDFPLSRNGEPTAAAATS